MNQCRVSFWIWSEEDVPDCVVQLQVVGDCPYPPPLRLMTVAMVLADCDWARLAVVEYERGGCWSHTFTWGRLSLSGLRSLCLQFEQS